MKLLTSTLGMFLLLGACQRQPDTAQPLKAPSKSHPAVAVQRGLSAEEQTAGMVEAATQGKSQAPIELKFELRQRPVQGKPFELEIALLPSEAAEPATVEVAGQDGLEIPASEARIEFPSVEPAEIYRHRITLKPSGDGVLMLTLTVSLRHDQSTDTRVFSVPLIVEAAPPVS